MPHPISCWGHSNTVSPFPHLSPPFSLAPGFLSPPLLFPISLFSVSFHPDPSPHDPFFFLSFPLFLQPPLPLIPSSLPPSSPNTKSTAVLGKQSHSLFHYQMGWPKWQPKPHPGPAVPLLLGVGPGLHRRAALNDKRGY